MCYGPKSVIACTLAKFHKSCKLRFAQVKLDRALKLVEKQKSTSTSVKDSERCNFLPYCFSLETTSPFSPQRFPRSLWAHKFSYECHIFMFTSRTNQGIFFYMLFFRYSDTMKFFRPIQFNIQVLLNILGDWVLVIYKLVLHKKECILFYLYNAR